MIARLRQRSRCSCLFACSCFTPVILDADKFRRRSIFHFLEVCRSLAFLALQLGGGPLATALARAVCLLVAHFRFNELHALCRSC